MCGPRFCAGCTTWSIASTATLSSNSNVFNGAANSQVMKKYLTIRQEPSLAVKHFRCTARLHGARAIVNWTGKPFVCKDFLHVAPRERVCIHYSSCTRVACTRCNRVHSLSCVG